MVSPLFGDYPLDPNLFDPSMLTLNDLFVSLLLSCRLSLIKDLTLERVVCHRSGD
jgi:hypothetical protein